MLFNIIVVIIVVVADVSALLDYLDDENSQTQNSQFNFEVGRKTFKNIFQHYL